MRGHFIKRYNRFLVDIRTRTGETITAYCPATGRLTTCVRDGAPVEYLRIEDSDRTLDYDWWSIKMDSSWVIIDTRPANQWLYWHRTAPWLPGDWSKADWHAEPTLTNGGRLDYRLDDGSGPDTWIEIKSVTWCENGTGYFPDAPTERGVRHLNELIELAQQGYDTYLIFVSMRSDIEHVKPAEDIDPSFTSTLQEASEAGVNLLGIESCVDDRAVDFTGRIPVFLHD